MKVTQYRVKQRLRTMKNNVDMGGFESRYELQKKRTSTKSFYRSRTNRDRTANSSVYNKSTRPSSRWSLRNIINKCIGKGIL